MFRFQLCEFVCVADQRFEMAFIEEVNEALPQMTPGDDFLGDENEGENGQIDQPNQLIQTPIQGNGNQGGEHEATPPPPPPPEGEQAENNTDTEYPTKYWCIFPQRIDTDGPHSEIIWNTADWELPRGRLLAEQGDQAVKRIGL